MKLLKNIKTKYLEIKEQFKNSLELFISVFTYPVEISLVIALMFSAFIVSSTYVYTGYYHSSTFLEGILIEAHGMLFDLWVIGVFILFFHEVDKRIGENQKYKDEIDDFRDWKSEEAKCRIVGNIKRLNKNNVTNINLSECFLKKVRLTDVNFQKSYLYRANFQGAILLRANFQKSDSKEVLFKGAELFFANFQEANLQAANFQGAILFGVNFQEADLRWKDFPEPSLGGACRQEDNPKEDVSLTIQQLSEVKTLYMAKLDPELMEQVKKKYPHLLEKPKEELE